MGALPPMRTLILCGGRGTRAHPHTVELPKPLLEVGGRPVLEHVMGIYARQGFRSFVLSGGFQIEKIEAFAAGTSDEWEVTVADTGLDTPTGERVRRCREELGDRFFVTYGDGVSDLDLGALYASHDGHDGVATMTTVPLRSPFGTVVYDSSGRVDRFLEKPVLEGHWINAGFFVFDAPVFDVWSGEDLEREVLPALAERGALYAYRHQGFWRSMDTYKDALELEGLCEEGGAPWERSPTRASS